MRQFVKYHLECHAKILYNRLIQAFMSGRLICLKQGIELNKIVEEKKAC